MTPESAARARSYRTGRVVTVNGHTGNIKTLSAEMGLNWRTVYNRIYRQGYTPEQALTHVPGKPLVAVVMRKQRRLTDIDVLRLRYAIRNGWKLTMVESVTGICIEAIRCITKGTRYYWPADLIELAAELRMPIKETAELWLSLIPLDAARSDRIPPKQWREYFI